jgi:hypothetical protein
MAEQTLAFKEKLKHVGFFTFKDLYNYCYEWLKDEGYLIFELEYTEKNTSFGKEIIIKWEAKKKISDYYRNIIKCNWHILGMNDAEVERNGKKEKTNKGEVKIEFNSFIEKDYENRWEDKPYLKFMRAIYDKYIMRTTFDLYEDRLAADTLTYVENIKAFLLLEGRK